MDISSIFLSGLIGIAPFLAAWIVVIVLASLMLRRGGGKAERFLVAGASLMLAKTLFGGFSANIRALEAKFNFLPRYIKDRKDEEESKVENRDNRRNSEE